MLSGDSGSLQLMNVLTATAMLLIYEISKLLLDPFINCCSA
jgi:hypothetical protein